MLGPGLRARLAAPLHSVNEHMRANRVHGKPGGVSALRLPLSRRLQRFLDGLRSLVDHLEKGLGGAVHLPTALLPIPKSGGAQPELLRELATLESRETLNAIEQASVQKKCGIEFKRTATA